MHYQEIQAGYYPAHAMWFPAILPEDVKCYWNVAMAYDVFFRGYGFSQFLHTSQCHIR